MPALTATVTREPSGEQFTVEFSGEAVIGRGRDAAIRLQDPMVSRSHATLGLRADGALIVSDAGSKNGTTVNGKLVFGEAVVFGWPVVIEIGPFRVEVRQAAEDATLRDRVIGWDEGELGEAPPIGATWLDTVNWQLYVDGEVALDTLSPVEYTVFNYLCSVAPGVVAAEDLGDAIWGSGRWDLPMLVDAITRIRQRLTAGVPGRRVIVSVPGQGYRIE